MTRRVVAALAKLYEDGKKSDNIGGDSLTETMPYTTTTTSTKRFYMQHKILYTTQKR